MVLWYDIWHDEYIYGLIFVLCVNIFYLTCKSMIKMVKLFNQKTKIILNVILNLIYSEIKTHIGVQFRSAWHLLAYLHRKLPDRHQKVSA